MVWMQSDIKNNSYYTHNDLCPVTGIEGQGKITCPAVSSSVVKITFGAALCSPHLCLVINAPPPLLAAFNTSRRGLLILVTLINTNSDLRMN